jgi:hypothetical protein
VAKTTKTAKSDRQAVIDQIRNQQKGAEKRRGLMIVGVCVLVALLIVGAAAYRPIKDWWDLRQFNSVGLASIGAPASSCQDVVTKAATGNQQHVPVGTPVTYDQAPPAFGKHWNQYGVAPAPMSRKLYTDDRPPLEALVHNLEHGYTILWYDSSVAGDNQQMQELRAIADKMAGTSNFRTKFIVAPWKSSDEGGKKFPNGEHVALTHWSNGGTGDSATGKQEGVWQYCSAVSGQALNSFMLKYPYYDSPEPAAM